MPAPLVHAANHHTPPALAILARNYCMQLVACSFLHAETPQVSLSSLSLNPLAHMQKESLPVPAGPPTCKKESPATTFPRLSLSPFHCLAFQFSFKKKKSTILRAVWAGNPGRWMRIGRSKISDRFLLACTHGKPRTKHWRAQTPRASPTISLSLPTSAAAAAV